MSVPGPFSLLRFLRAYWRTRRLQRQLKTRADIEAWQARQIARWRQTALSQVGCYRQDRDTPFETLPLIDKAMLMARFADFNRPGIDASQGWAAFTGSGKIGPLTVGASTGTSGNRGLFIISGAERWEWLGVIVAKTMPKLRRARVALVLPLNTGLYDAAAGSGFIRLKFFDLKLGIEAWREDLASFAPDTLIAPPKVLRRLAESGLPLSPKTIFSVAEVLDPLDREIIEERFGLRLREIYMATEGLIGVACEHGTLHLCEDVMKIEFEDAAPGSGLVAPIITDFTRTTQVMARYRMNDLLRLSDQACPCGSPLQAVAQVEGRLDDVLLLPEFNGHGEVFITPDILRNAIVDADRRIDDFRLVQTGADTLELALLTALPDDATEAARQAVEAAVQKAGGVTTTVVLRVPAFPVSARKLRRIERHWQGPA
jgi:putative adenylate-forming enzyme